MSFQDGRHSILSLVCLAFLCSVFKVRIQMPDIRCQISDLCSGLNPEFKQNSVLSEFKIQFLVANIRFPHLTSDVCYLQSVLVGLNGLEPSTSRLSGGRSNQLSYKPIQMPDVRLQTSGCSAFAVILPTSLL